MGPPGFHGCRWTGILLSASLLTTWNLPVTAQLTRHADLLSITQMERGPQSSSLSPGAIAGIVIGILVAIALVLGLGYFFYSTKDRWTRKRSVSDRTPKTTPSTSVTQNPPESTANNPKPVYDSMLKPQGEARGKKILPPVSPEQLYEKKPPSAAPEGSWEPPSQIQKPLAPAVPDRNSESNYEKKPPSADPEGSWEPPSQIWKQPLVPPVPDRNSESNYEKKPPCAAPEGSWNPPSQIWKQLLVPPEPDRNSESNYEKKPPSAAPKGSWEPPSQIWKQPLVLPVPERNSDLNYEKWLNPQLSLYCKNNPSA